MNEIFSAIVFKANDSGESDKRVTLITPYGVKYALMRGVKRQKAKLRAAALPFAFFEYTAVKRGSSYTIIGASQIEDLSMVSDSLFKLTAASIILEIAFIALKDESIEQFIFMLKRLKDVIYADETGQNDLSYSYLSAIRFIQYIIHDAGYGYVYTPLIGDIDSSIKLLTFLHFMDANEKAKLETDEQLIIKTLIKIINNFEIKFEMEIASKKLISLI